MYVSMGSISTGIQLKSRARDIPRDMMGELQHMIGNLTILGQYLSYYVVAKRRNQITTAYDAR